MSEKKSVISDIMLERFYLKELPDDRMQEISRLLKQDAGTRERLRRLELSDREILQTYPVEEEVGIIQRKIHLAQVTQNVRRVGSKNIWWKKMPVLAPAGVLAILMFIFLPILINPGREEQKVAYIGSKGLEPNLQIYLKQRDSSLLLKHGDTVHRGDLLQLGYIRGSKRYGVIFSLDGRGSLTLHYPPETSRSADLGREGRQLLDYSYELDDAPRFERFYFITSEKPFDYQSVINSSEKQKDSLMSSPEKRLALPKGLSQRVFTLHKAEN